MRTNEGQSIIVLEDKGYKLTSLQKDLTIPQELFLFHGWKWLEKEKEKISKRNSKLKGR